MNIQLILKSIPYIAIIALISSVIFMSKSINNKNNIIDRLRNNEIAIENELSKANDKNIEFIYTISELKNSKDSINRKLLSVKKELKIKDREIERLGYLLSTAKKGDTLFVKDTIFREDVKLDTLLQNDEWYKCNIKLEYPNKIFINPEFKSEKYIIASTEKIFVGERKKCFIARLFQKRQTVVDVSVIEKNPYITNEKERFIKIIKK